MAREDRILVDLETGEALSPVRQFDRPEDDPILEAAKDGTAWALYVPGAKVSPRNGETAVRDRRYDAETGTFYDDWKIEGTYVPTLRDVTPDEVRWEASRRMQLIVGARDERHLDIVLSNGTREAVRLLRKGESNWTPDDTARAAQLDAVEAAIDGIRERSNALEAMVPIPQDYKDDKHWAG